MKPEEIEFQETCCSCPEAYRLFYKGEEVGYMRLRSGYLCLTGGIYVAIFANDRSSVIDVWDYCFEGDPFKGSFDDDLEREHFKELSAQKLVEYYDSQNQFQG